MSVFVYIYILAFFYCSINLVLSLHLEKSTSIESICTESSNECSILSDWSYDGESYILAGSVSKEPYEIFFAEISHRTSEVILSNWTSIFISPAQKPAKLFGDTNYVFMLTSNCDLYRNALSSASDLPHEKIKISSNLRCIDATINGAYVYVLAVDPSSASASRVIRVSASEFSQGSQLEYLFVKNNQQWQSITQGASSIFLSSNQENGQASVCKIHIPAFDSRIDLNVQGAFSQVDRILTDESEDNILYAAILDRSTDIPSAQFYSIDLTDSTMKTKHLAPVDKNSHFSEMVYFRQGETNITTVAVSIEEILYQINITQSNGKLGVSSHSFVNETKVVHLAESGNDLFVLTRSDSNKFAANLFTILPPLPEPGFRLPPWIVAVVIGLIIAIEYIIILIYCGASEIRERAKGTSKGDTESV